MTVWPPSFIPVEIYDPLSFGEAVLIYLGIPLLIILVVSVLVSAPSWTRQGRHRPGQGWDADPLTLGASERGAEPAELAAGQNPADPGGGSGRW
ncbi:MAG TPA: hypothetical protein VFN19_09375 [Candidatus Nanopelagicales bacterium]|jgi:hypothetical protein|nr:hypothetical protein [Candidatus Nanopelagicales bacterium]